MADRRNALSDRDSHIWTLRIGGLILAGVIGGLLLVMSAKQNEITVHVPPVITRGTSLQPGELQPSNSWAFAHYVWNGLNEWNTNGRKDYLANIAAFECLVTPEFKSYLDRSYDEKRNDGELDRVRRMTQAVAYQPSFAQALGNNTYAVTLIMRLVETVGHSPVKDTTMRYGLRIVPDNRACNPMGMAVAGFTHASERYAVEPSAGDLK